MIKIATIACPEKESSLLRCTLNAKSYRGALRQPKLWGVPNSIAVTSGRTRPTALRITKVSVWHEADLSQISAVAGFADLHTAKLKGTV